MNLVVRLFVLFTVFFITAHSALTNVTCYPEYMEVYFDAEAMKGSTPYLDDKKCSEDYSVTTTDKFVIVKVPFIHCGTERKLAEDYIAFYNKIKVRLDNPGPIIRSDDTYPVGCILGPTFGTVTRNKKPLSFAGTIKTYFYGNSSYTFRLELYTDKTFAEKVDFPFSSQLRQEIYFELSVNQTGDNLALETEKCIATPTEDLDTTRIRYPMIRDSCLLDPTMIEYSPPEDRVRRYSIQSFLFKKNLPVIYFHCFMRVCFGKEKNECKEGCKTTGVRRRRSSNNEKEEMITYGPIFLKSRKKHEDITSPHDEGSLYLTVIGIFAGAALLACGIIIGAVVYKNRRQHYVQADKNEML